MSISKTTTVKLNTGAEMPVVGLGTWKSEPGKVEKAVEYALKDAGYIHIDTATAYSNEKEVGEGIKASGVDRSKIFITTKLNNNDHGNVEDALDYSLKQLQCGYLDLWLMHWPAPMSDIENNVADKSIDWLDTWKEMTRVYKANPDKVKAIGVSNVSVPFLKRLLDSKPEVIPAVNQIELHPSLPQKELVEVCTEIVGNEYPELAPGKEKWQTRIVLTSYSPLGSDKSPLLENETIQKIAKKHNVDPAAVLVSYQANHNGRIVLPKSVTPSRIKSNAEIVKLDVDDMVAIAHISQDKKNVFRVCSPDWTGWGDLGFDLEGEK